MIWDRQLNESKPAYDAFVTYLDLGENRSIIKAAKQLGKTRSLIGEWSRRWKWQARLRGWEDNNQNALIHAQEDEIKKRARIWIDRQEKLRSEEYEIGILLLEKAKTMLKYPLVRQSTKREELPDELSPDGKTIKRVTNVTEVHPARWDFSTAVRFLETADRLQRLATGLPLDHTAISGPDGGAIQIDANQPQLTDEDFERAIIIFQERIIEDAVRAGLVVPVAPQAIA